MICPCGGLAPGTDYFPVGQNVKQTTYACTRCGRRRIEIRDENGKLIEERG